jgi:hypothetical protein
MVADMQITRRGQTAQLELFQITKQKFMELIGVPVLVPSVSIASPAPRADIRRALAFAAVAIGEDPDVGANQLSQYFSTRDRTTLGLYAGASLLGILFCQEKPPCDRRG